MASEDALQGKSKRREGRIFIENKHSKFGIEPGHTGFYNLCNTAHPQHSAQRKMHDFMVFHKTDTCISNAWAKCPEGPFGSFLPSQLLPLSTLKEATTLTFIRNHLLAFLHNFTT